MRILSGAGETAGMFELFHKAVSTLKTFPALASNTGLFLNFSKTDTFISTNFANFAVSHLLANTNVHNIPKVELTP